MIRIEVTDTFGGEANYSWVKRYELDVVEGHTELQTMRRIKKVIGWTGVRCKKTDWGDMVELRPSNFCNVCFIRWGDL